MAEDMHRSQFRIPNSLYERIKASARHNRRSANAELVARLEGSFAEEDRVLGMDLQDYAAEIIDAVESEELAAASTDIKEQLSTMQKQLDQISKSLSSR